MKSFQSEKNILKASRILNDYFYVNDHQLIVVKLFVVEINFWVVFDCVTRLTFGTTPLGVVFWQWVNQSYNVMNNYVNRSSSTIDFTPLMQSYGLAVFTSCSIALGAKRLLKAVPALAGFGPFIPYLAVWETNKLIKVQWTKF